MSMIAILVLVVYVVIGLYAMIRTINDKDDDLERDIWWWIGSIVGTVLWPLLLVLSYVYHYRTLWRTRKGGDL